MYSRLWLQSSASWDIWLLVNCSHLEFAYLRVGKAMSSAPAALTSRLAALSGPSSDRKSISFRAWCLNWLTSCSDAACGKSLPPDIKSNSELLASLVSVTANKEYHISERTSCDVIDLLPWGIYMYVCNFHGCLLWYGKGDMLYKKTAQFQSKIAKCISLGHIFKLR